MEMELKEGIAKLISVPKGQRDVIIWDSKQAGFFLRKFASGRATWGVRCRVNGKKQHRIHLDDANVRGTLANARRRAAEVRAKARLGVDVVVERAAAAAASAKTITLSDVVERYLADRRDAKRRNGEPKWRPRYFLEVHRQLTKDWAPLGGNGIKAITRQDIVGVIDGIAAKQGRVAADRARTALSSLFVWAIDRGHADASPVIHIKSRAEGGARDRKLTEDELREVWLAADGIGGDYGRIVKLLILTGQRREEIGRLAWAEIHWNGDGARIELPQERTKNHREHIIPLSAEAVAALPPRPDSPTVMVFGRRGTGFSGWSKGKEELDEAIADARRARGVKAAMKAWRLHDLRRSLVTHMNELGIAPPHIVEAIVNHVSGTKAGVAGTYNRALYLEERTQALAAWGRHVRELVGG